MENLQKGCVFPRKTKTRGLVHVIRYRVATADGKTKHVSETVHTPKKKEAERVLRERLDAINGGEKLPTEMTFEQFVHSHWEPYLIDLKPSTQSAHRSNMKKHLLPVLGQYKLKDIRPTMLSQLLEHERQAGLKPKTRLNLHLLLGSIFNLAVDLELLNENPMRRIPKAEIDWEEKPTLTPRQIEAVISSVKVQYRPMFVVLALTGLRIGEVLGLKWQDVDFGDAKLYVRRSVWRGKEFSPKSKKSIRAKHMVGTLSKALAWQRGVSHFTEPQDYVFAGNSGKPQHPDDIRRRVLYPAMKAAGIAIAPRAYGFHIFRHSAGTEMQRATSDLKQTSSFLGHASTAITGDVYLHMTPDTDRASVEKLESVLSFPEGLFPTVPKPVIQLQ